MGQTASGAIQHTTVASLKVPDVFWWKGEFFVPLDDGTVYAFFESFFEGSDADLFSSQISNASYTGPNGQYSGALSSVPSQTGSVPAPVRFPPFSLPAEGFGTYQFTMDVRIWESTNSSYSWWLPGQAITQSFPTPSISSVSPNSLQRGTLTDVTIAGTGLGAPDESLDAYYGITAINFSNGGLTGWVTSPQPFPTWPGPPTGNSVYATLDATAANPETYQVSLTVFGYTTNPPLTITVGDSGPNIVTITDAAENPIGSLPAGTSSYIILWGTGFGAQGSQSSVAICPTGANPCGSSDVSVTKVAFWGDHQINLLVATSPTSQGTYDVQLISGGVTGNGFLGNGGPTGAQSNRRQVEVGGTQLTLNWPSLMQIQAQATPAGGTFTESLTLIAGTTNFVSWNLPANVVTNGNTVTQYLTLLDPRPGPGGTPTAGGLAQVTVSYQPPSGSPVSKQLSVATFGLSCYNSALESEWGSPPSSCLSTTINGVTYSDLADPDPPKGLQGTYCNAFIQTVKLNGSGYLNTPQAKGQVVKYLGGDTYEVLPVLTASDGTPPVGGITLARDRNYFGTPNSDTCKPSGYGIIPTKNNVTLTLDGVANIRLANDTGACNYIFGYRLDLYQGSGKSVCQNYSNPIVVGVCSPGLALCPSQQPQ